MLDLKLPPPPTAPATATAGPARPGGPSVDDWLGVWIGRASARVRSAAQALASRIGPVDPVVAEFAALAAPAREPDEVRMALVRLAAMACGAERVELVRDRDGRPSRRLAAWPPPSTGHCADVRSVARGPIFALPGRGRRLGPPCPVLQLPLKAGDGDFGTLRVTAGRRRPWTAWTVRRLETLCSIAAAAERGLAAPTAVEADPAALIDPEIGPRGSMMLGAFLGFALAQAHRRIEPLALLDVAVDRLVALRELLGEETAEAAIARAARAIKSTVRASDVVVRLEDGRLAVILPNAQADSALRVAEAVRAAIARVGAASADMPSLTASIGIASYPDHAHDAASLRANASSALTRAKALGPDRVAGPTGVAKVYRAG